MIKEIQYYAGDYLEIDFVPFRRVKHRGGRGPKTKPTREAQAKLNQENRERELCMLIHENFTNKDYALHPTYSDMYLPPDKETALRDRRNFINRVKRLYKKFNVEFKAIFVLEKTERYHHHMIFSGGVPRELIEKAWGMGTCNCDRLQFSERGVKGLSCYIVKSADNDYEGERCTFKSYSYTRNIRKPAPPKVKAVSTKEFGNLWDSFDSRALFERKYKEYFYVEAERTDNIEHGERYLRVKLCRRDAQLDFINDLDYSGCLNVPIRRRKAANKLKHNEAEIPPA